MSTVTPPRVGIVLGVAKIDGKEVEVLASDEYMRWFTALMDRVGGVKSIDLDELAAIVVSPLVAHVPDETPPPALSIDDVIQRAEDAARQQVQAMALVDATPDNAAEIAALREEVAMTIRGVKRIIPGSIVIPGGFLTQSSVISPAITGPAELRMTGSTTSSSTLSDAMVGISLSGSTVTASRVTGAGGGSTVYFEITEHY